MQEKGHPEDNMTADGQTSVSNGFTEKRESFSRTIQKALSNSLDPAEVVRYFDRLAQVQWKYERADFLWLDRQNMVLRPMIAYDPPLPLIFYPGSLAERISQSKLPLSITLDGTDLPAEAKWLSGQGYRSAVAWPLFYHEKLCASVIFSYRTAMPLGPDNETMNELAQPLAAALNNARIYTMANRQLEMSALLNRAGVAIALGEADLRSVLTKTLEEVREYIGSHNIRLYRLDEDEQILYPEAVVFAPGRYTPVEWEMFAHMTLRLGEGMTGWAAATGTAVISGDAEHDPRGKHLPGTDYIDESMICVPLKVRESILGVLTMAKIGLFEFGEPELMLASSLAAQIAIALENTRLLQSQLEAREQLERDIERIRHLEAVREEFLYSVSHELKTPLAVITAALEMVDQTPPEERVECLKAYYDLLMRSSERLQRLVGNLLETSKATSGSIELYRQREEPRALVTEAIRRMQPEASSKKLQFQLEIAGSEATSYLDRNRTLQVIENLLSNAIKYSPVGATIIVSASSEPDGEVRISITDEGIGISLEDQQHIFDRFFRSGSGQAISATGTGLGLFLSKALVEAHGGEMGLDSELGRGTRVWFTIPTSNPIRH